MSRRCKLVLAGLLLLLQLAVAPAAAPAAWDASDAAACGQAEALAAPRPAASAGLGQDPLLQLILQEDRQDRLRAALRGEDLDRARGKPALTPLSAAAAGGRLQAVAVLIELGASLEKADRAGETPLMFALRHGQAASVCTLLRHGAKWPDPVRFPDLLPATQLTDDGAAAALLARLLLQRGFPADARLQGDTALHLALQLGHRASVAVLREHGADSAARDHRGLSALDIARQAGISDWLQPGPPARRGTPRAPSPP